MLFNSISIFNTTVRQESSLHRSKINDGSFCFHGASRLSRVPWSRVEGNHFTKRLVLKGEVAVSAMKPSPLPRELRPDQVREMSADYHVADRLHGCRSMPLVTFNLLVC